MNNNSPRKSYPLLLHIVIIILVIFIIYSIYDIAGNKNWNGVFKNAQNMYKEKIEDSDKLKSSDIDDDKNKFEIERFEKYKFEDSIILNITGNVKNLNIKIPIPTDEDEKQYISELTIIPEPLKIYYDDINNIVEYNYGNVGSGKMNIKISATANIRTFDYITAKLIDKNHAHEKDLSKYLNPELLIESDDFSIKRIASKLKGKTQQETVDNVYKYIQQTLTYTVMPDIGAKEALKQRKGKCSEYSTLMVALLRANSVPSRIVIGYIAKTPAIKHTWVEVYYDKYGWVCYDPTTTGFYTNIYQNGQLVKKEYKLDSQKAVAKYISFARNRFSPISVYYGMADRTSGSVNITENMTISKISESDE